MGEMVIMNDLLWNVQKGYSANMEGSFKYQRGMYLSTGHSIGSMKSKSGEFIHINVYLYLVIWHSFTKPALYGWHPNSSVYRTWNV